MGKVLCLARLLLALSFATSAFAQVNAAVTGAVNDATGALIPGVEVMATNVNTGIASIQVSNESGAYNFASLQPGAYTLTATLPGFQTARYNNVQLSQGQQVRLNFTLEVGGVATQVRIRINETAGFTLRADAINMLNKPQWGNPNVNINATNFGRITSAGGARTFTINARIDF